MAVYNPISKAPRTVYLNLQIMNGMVLWWLHPVWLKTRVSCLEVLLARGPEPDASNVTDLSPAANGIHAYFYIVAPPKCHHVVTVTELLIKCEGKKNTSFHPWGEWTRVVALQKSQSWVWLNICWAGIQSSSMKNSNVYHRPLVSMSTYNFSNILLNTVTKFMYHTSLLIDCVILLLVSRCTTPST